MSDMKFSRSSSLQDSCVFVPRSSITLNSGWVRRNSQLKSHIQCEPEVENIHMNLLGCAYCVSRDCAKTKTSRTARRSRSGVSIGTLCTSYLLNPSMLVDDFQANLFVVQSLPCFECPSVLQSLLSMLIVLAFLL